MARSLEMGEPPPWILAMMEAVSSAPASWFSSYLPPPGGGQRQSAVLILFGADDTGQTDVVLTQRASAMRNHPGQVSFPGGGAEQGDVDPAATALREAQEEIGLDPESVKVLGSLPALHIPVSGYDVTPIVAWWHHPHQVSARQPEEVDQVVRAAIDHLVDPTNRFSVGHPSGYIGAAFEVEGLLVWGFTAGLLDRLFELAQIAPAWQRANVRPLPA